MKILKNIFLIIFIAIFLIPIRSFTQIIKSEDYNTWSVGVKYGILSFYGDVRQMKYATDNPYKKTNTGFTFEGTKNFNDKFGAKLQLLSGKLSGSSPNLNLHFNSSITEASLSGVVNLNDLISYYPKKDKIVNTYIFAGFGITAFRSAVRSFDEDVFIKGYGWDSLGLSKTAEKSAMVFPFGIGIKFRADERFDVGLELALHLTNTDKLDAWVVKNSYTDRFSYASISFTYKIGNKKEYVDWVNPFKDIANTDVLLAHKNTAVNNNTTISNNTNTTNTQINAVTTNTNSNKVSTTSNIQNFTTAKMNKPNSVTSDTIFKKDIEKTNTVKNIHFANALNQNTSNIKANNTDTPKPNATIQNTNINAQAAAAIVVKKFFIIARSFSTEQQAKEGVVLLQKNGFPNAEIVGVNDAGNWRICYKGYATKEEAMNDLIVIKQTKDPSAWIFEKKH
jgi:hypothetical protein